MNQISKLLDYYHENKLSHVYLLETNNVDNCLNDTKKLVKQIFCKDVYNDECNKCNLCNLINQEYLPSFQVVEPDGSMIKKEQVLSLKKAFSMSNLYTKESIYIIKSAEKLNGAAANTILKFIEEPDDNIIGFLITDNINKVLPTIKSRCELLRVTYEDKDNDLDSIDKDIINNAIFYLRKIEVEKTNGILYNKEVIDIFKERDYFIKIFNTILLIYEELLKSVLGLENNFHYNELNSMTNLGIDEIKFRINLVIDILDDASFNGNIDLLLDRYVIAIEVGDEIG